MKKFYIVTNYNNHLPQYTHETNSINIEVLSDYLDKSFDVLTISLDDLANDLVCSTGDLSHNYYLFCSSQIESYKMAILDVAFEVFQRGGVLVPKYDFLLAHENKFYQELYKKRCGVLTSKATLFTNSNNFSRCSVPAVIKSYSGFGSRGVSLVKNADELPKVISKNMLSYCLDKLDMHEIGKSFVKINYKFKGLYPKKFGRVVAQDFIEDLKYDWKVLVFGNSIFTLKRFVRDDDFRASGSGKFDFDAVPNDKLIEFAYSCRSKLDVPFVSLDIAESSDGAMSVIEYQSVHFGLVTALNCHQYYTIEGGKVNKIERGIENIESFFASSIIGYLRK